MTKKKRDSKKGRTKFWIVLINKDLFKTVVFNLFSKIECITLKKLKSDLEKNHNISISKYKL